MARQCSKAERCINKQSTALACADSESGDEWGEMLAEHESDGEEAPPNDPKVPHRWRVTIMMALAFVLCNMDKVCRPFLPHGTARTSFPDSSVQGQIYRNGNWPRGGGIGGGGGLR